MREAKRASRREIASGDCAVIGRKAAELGAMGKWRRVPRRRNATPYMCGISRLRRLASGLARAGSWCASGSRERCSGVDRVGDGNGVKLPRLPYLARLHQAPQRRRVRRERFFKDSTKGKERKGVIRMSDAEVALELLKLPTTATTSSGSSTASSNLYRILIFHLFTIHSSLFTRTAARPTLGPGRRASRGV